MVDPWAVAFFVALPFTLIGLLVAAVFLWSVACGIAGAAREFRARRGERKPPDVPPGS